MRAGKLILPAVLAAGLIGLGAPAAGAANARPMGTWWDGGTYPTLGDCQQSAQHANPQRYECDPIYYPDGQIDYWQLWLYI